MANKLWEVGLWMSVFSDRTQTEGQSIALSHYFPVKTIQILSETNVKSVSTNVPKLKLKIQVGHLC